MKCLKLTDTITAAELALNALPLALGEFVPNDTGYSIKTNVLSGNESLLEVFQNSVGEKIIRNFKTADAVAGRWVVGLAPQNVIEDEFDNYEIFGSVADNANASNALFRGKLKESRTEAYTPAFLSFPHVILKEGL